MAIEIVMRASINGTRMNNAKERGHGGLTGPGYDSLFSYHRMEP